MNPAELAEILQLPVIRSEKFNYGDNTFIGYTLEAADYEMVQKAYLHVKLNNAGARHILAAWRIPGLPQYKKEDSCDDQEIGFGRYLLSILKQNNITHRGYICCRDI